MADISKITLPSGNTYDIKDTVARQMATGVMKIIGKTTTALTDGSTTNPIVLITDPTTTPPTTESYTATDGDTVIYDSTEFVWVDGTKTGSTSHWVEFGDLTGLGNMAFVDQGTVTVTPSGSNDSSAVTFSGGSSDSVLGADTTFQNGTSAVSFGQHTKATVLTSDVTATVPKTTATTKYLTATASGTSVSISSDGDAITDLGTPSTETFVKSYPGQSSNLVTTTIYGVGSQTTEASKATAGTAVAVATTDTDKTVATGSVTGNEIARGSNNDTVMWGANVDNEVLSFTFKKLATTLVTPAKSNGSITPYSFTPVTVPIKDNSTTTVATGSVAANGGGGSVLVGLGTPDTDKAVTEYASPQSATFVKGVSVSSQPNITLNVGASTSQGAVTYVQGISDSGSTNPVTFDTTTSGTTASAITELGAATAAAQQITVGTNDRVTAVTDIGTGTAAGQTFHGTTATYDVNPKTT